MELIVISKPNFFKGEAQLINALFRQGMQRFHLRKEDADRRAYEKLMSQIEPTYLDRIALHQFHELAADFGIQRLHFKEAQRLASLHLNLQEQNSYTLSTSIHTPNISTELQRFKYTFLGPVFQSLSKEKYPGILPNSFQLKTSVDLKVIALGGISVSKINQIEKMNFDGLAVLGAIWNVPEQAIENFKQLQKACQTTA